ncbi:hypothetical protein QHL1GM_06015 [Halomonas sp. QHL1]|nr:hypothetical protein QHL1GM_06015 [Halomonas sp. QHL1]
MLAVLFLASLLQPLGKVLHNKGSVDRYLGMGKISGQTAEEGRRNVADDLDHIVRIAATGRRKALNALIVSLPWPSTANITGF